MTPAISLLCPVDGQPLEPALGGVLQCAHGHSFDRAREGYYNLLLVQHKASRDPGDTREMVAARRRFLDAGVYAPIAGRLIDLVARTGARTILDAGCGDGYYLDRLANTPVATIGRIFVGIDISKWAVRAAARRNRLCFWAVASNRQLPIRSAGIDLVLSMFGFPVWSEFARVQCEGGHVLLVDAGPDHLIELRRIIYPRVDQSQPPSLAAAERAGFQLIDTQHQRFPFKLSSAAQIADLMAMTPHGHRASVAGRTALSAVHELGLTGEVVFRVLRKID